MSQPGNLKPDVRLWRIEHPVDGIGPFNSQNLSGVDRPYIDPCWGDEEVYESTWCPNPHSMCTPRKDSLLRQGDLPRWDYWSCTPDLKFAYPSRPEMLRWWCGRALRDLAAMGYVVKVVRVPWQAHTRFGQQARYDSKRATVLDVLSPVDALWA